MKFTDLGLVEPIIRAVAAEGYTTPTPIQRQAIPEALAGKDLLGCAQTGTGKTGAFALPILQRLARPISENGQRLQTTKKTRNSKHSHKGRNPRNSHSSGKPRALILCPTRELASQILDSFNTYGRNLPLRHAVIFGGVSQFRQIKQLRAGVDVLVATPGRLLDLINQGYVDLQGIETLVLDEADRMLDMGFIPDIRKIIECMPTRRQTLLFSATMPNDIRKLADSVLVDPISVEVAPVASTTDAVDQSVYMVTQSHKATLLIRVLQKDNVERTLIFTRTKHGADKLVKVLHRAGITSEAIHGNKNQNARTRALKAFKAGRVPVLVATDIASRGIDVEEITHVINYDMPNAAETYVHRIGRTARAGATGFAISFCDYHEINDLRAIERMIKKPLEVMKDEPDLVYDAPAKQRKPKRQNSQGKSKFGGHGSRGNSGGRRSSGSASASGTSGKWRGKSKTKGKSAKPAAGYKPRKQR